MGIVRERTRGSSRAERGGRWGRARALPWRREGKTRGRKESGSLVSRVSSVRWAWGRPSRKEGSAGLAGLGSPSPLFLL